MIDRIRPLLALGLCLAASYEISAVLITHRVTIQPIRVHGSNGDQANPAGTLFTEETTKIWSQAGIEVKFLPIKNYTNAAFIRASSDITKPNSLFALAQAPGNGASTDPAVINLWFVKDIDGGSSVIGFAQQSQVAFGTPRPKNGIIISDFAFSFGSGQGMRDIFAHELGHNLGLFHGLDESGAVQAEGEQNLMSRHANFPARIEDIFPDGAQLDQMNALQATRAKVFSGVVRLLPLAEQYEYPSLSKPAITVEPVSAAAHVGENAQFSVAAAGPGTLATQWFKNNGPLGGSTAATLSLTDVQAGSEGSYYAVVSNGAGSATSSIVSLQVTALRINSTVLSPSSVTLAWDGLAGHSYKLFAAPDLSQPFNEVAQVTIRPASGPATIERPRGESERFFRLKSGF